MNKISDSSMIENTPTTSETKLADQPVDEKRSKNSTEDIIHEVRVRLVVEKLVEVSLLNQSFTVCMVIEASWADYKMKELKVKKELFDINVSEDSNQLKGKLYLKEDDTNTAFFAPRLVIDNAMAINESEIWYHCFDDSPGDSSSPIIISMRWRLTCTLQEEMELANFPFDNQLLTIRLHSLWPMDCMFRDIKVRIDFPDGLGTNIQDICHRVFSLLRTAIECAQKCVGVLITNKQQVEKGSQSTVLSMRIIIPNPEVSSPAPHLQDWNEKIEREVNEMMPEGYRIHIFDVQSNSTKVKLVKNKNNRYPSSLKTNNFIQRAEYAVGSEMLFEESSTTEEQSISRHQYSLLLVSISLRRKVTLWMMNIALPLTTCSTVGWAAFAIEPSALADRCSVTLVMLLTMVAYKNMVSSALPPINYLTILDWYILFCFGNMILVIIENVVATLWSVEPDAELPGILIIICIYIAGMLIFVGYAMGVWFQKLRSALPETEIKPLQNKRMKHSQEKSQHIIWVAPMDKQINRTECMECSEGDLEQKIKKFLQNQNFAAIFEGSESFDVRCYKRNHFYSLLYPDKTFKPEDDYMFALIFLPLPANDDVMREAMKKLRKAFSKSSIQGWMSSGNAMLEPLNSEFYPVLGMKTKKPGSKVSGSRCIVM